MDREDVVFLCASSLVATGAGMWYVPAGVVVLGSCTFAYLVLSRLFGSRK